MSSLARGEDDTFDIMDRDGDGLVKTEEIQSAWAKPDVYGNAAQRSGGTATMNWADANGDDAISRKEWADANAKDGKDEKDYGRGGTPRSRIRGSDVEVSGEDEFRRADADADGHLTPEELAAHWAGGDPDATSEQARKYAAEMTVQESDSDKDGRLSEDEWRTCTRRRRTTTTTRTRRPTRRTTTTARTSTARSTTTTTRTRAAPAPPSLPRAPPTDPTPSPRLITSAPPPAPRPSSTPPPRAAPSSVPRTRR